MNALLLCWSLLTSQIDTPAALRGCLHAPAAAVTYPADPQTLLAIGYVESRWQPDAVSSSGCCGAWQVCPQWSSLTCEQLGTTVGGAAGAAASLRYWSNRCHGSRDCALRGYYCGVRGSKGKCGSEYVAKVGAASRLLWR